MEQVMAGFPNDGNGIIMDRGPGFNPIDGHSDRIIADRGPGFNPIDGPSDRIIVDRGPQNRFWGNQDGWVAIKDAIRAYGWISSSIQLNIQAKAACDEVARLLMSIRDEDADGTLITTLYNMGQSARGGFQLIYSGIDVLTASVKQVVDVAQDTSDAAKEAVRNLKNLF